MRAGSKMTVEQRARVSAGKRGRSNGRLGLRHSMETRAKISRRTREAMPRGAALPSYKDGRLAERRGARFSTAYKRWRYDVFVRDAFTCQDCGDGRGGNLVAHHVLPFADYPALRFEVSNGVTLCSPCHDERHRTGNL